jgi:VWFA-related protein
VKPQEGEAEKNSEGTYVFRAEATEVMLQATVVDDQKRLVTTLKQGDFQVFENEMPQRILFFQREDVPVALAILIDNSASMADKLRSVDAAAVNLVRASNPQDQVCIINFDNEVFLDQDFTSDVSLLEHALHRLSANGPTSLYDAVAFSSAHLMKNATLPKKVIMVVTDGEDTSSHSSLEAALRAVSTAGGPTVYTIGLLSKGPSSRQARRVLRTLAEQTGGAAFFPLKLGDVDAISQQIARDIRSQYTIRYKSSAQEHSGGFRHVSVRAHAPGFKHLQVRTRSGYYETNGETAPASP